MENSENSQEQRVDRSLMIRRAIVWGISLVVGFAAAFGIIILLETDLETYSTIYYVLTALPISALVLIWGDVVMGTKILPD